MTQDMEIRPTGEMGGPQGGATRASTISDYLTGLYGEKPDGLIGICSTGDWAGKQFATIEGATQYAAQLDARGVKGVYHRSTTLADFLEPGKRGTSEDSAAAYFFALDADVLGPGHKGTNLPADRKDVEKIIQAAGAPDPTAWIFSGGGYYPQWRFLEPIDLRDPEQRALVADQFAQLSARFIAAAKDLGWHLDNVKDLARVFRLPGTHNRKVEPIEATFEGITGEPIYLTALMRSVRETIVPVAAPAPLADELFDDAAEDRTERRFTTEQAKDFIRIEREKLAGATGGYRQAIMNFALACAHFPWLIKTQETCAKHVIKALGETWGSTEPDDEDRKWIATAYADFEKWKGTEKGWIAVEVKEEGENPYPYDSIKWHQWENAQQQTQESDGKLTKLRARLHTRSGLDLIPPPTPLIKGVLDVGTVAFLSGKFGTYKTFVSVAWACSIATGKPWEDREVTSPGPVIYVAAEGVSGIKSRIRSWEIAFNDGAQVPDDQLYVMEGRIRLNDRDEVKLFHQLVQPIQPALIVIDTLHACSPGAEENSSKDMGEVFDSLSTLRRALKCTILANHHTGHAGERSRGSSAIEDDADTSWVIQLKDSEDRSPANQRTLRHRKTKDGALSEPMDIILKTIEETGSGYITSGQVEGGQAPFLVAQAICNALDQAGAPKSIGRDKAKALVSHIKAGNDVWADAMKMWKNGSTSENAFS